MFLRYCRRTVSSQLNNSEAYRGSSIILGMVVIGGLIAAVAILISHLSEAF